MLSPMNAFDPFYFKRSKQTTPSDKNPPVVTEPPKVENKPIPRQNTNRKNRKHFFITRSVWYDDREDAEEDEFDSKTNLSSGTFGLRKASSLDSLLFDKKRTRAKITKDMISAPTLPRKICNYWNTTTEKEIDSIVEENASNSSVISDSDNSDSDSESDISSSDQNEYEVENDTKSTKQNDTSGSTSDQNESEVENDTKSTKQNDARGSTSDQNKSEVDNDTKSTQQNDTSGSTSHQNETEVENDTKSTKQNETSGSTSDHNETEVENDTKSTKQSGTNEVGPEIFQNSVGFEETEVQQYSDALTVNQNASENSQASSSFPDNLSNENRDNNSVTISIEFASSEVLDTNEDNNNDAAIEAVEDSSRNVNIKIDDNNSTNDKTQSEKIDSAVSFSNLSSESTENSGTKITTDFDSITFENNNYTQTLKLSNQNVGKQNDVIRLFVSPDKPIDSPNVQRKKIDKNNPKKNNRKQKKQKKDGGTNLVKMKFLSKSTDIFSSSAANKKSGSEDYEEVLRTLQSNKDEPLSRSVGPFPKTDDYIITDEVQLRPQKIENRIRQSKTLDCDPRRYYRNQEFDIKGCTKIQLPENVSLKLKKNEYLRYQNNSIIKNDETHSEVLKFGVLLKSAKLINKREVELKDINNHAFILVFDSSKDAKTFIDSEKVLGLSDNEKSTITKTLLRLLGKRSSREVLEKKGIYQNEPIFGNTLKNIYNVENGVPKFILKTMELIERPDNITSLGLYRTSGNLATIQKIRLEVDKGNLDILDMYSKDPDVLTGSLKLFFRELKEPLLSCKTCDNLLEFAKNDKNYCKKDRENIRTILSHLPPSNADTLLALIRHLIEVVKFKDQNKMDTYNLAVCWGPTIIFATDNLSTKDLVTQSAEATKLFDSLLSFYINNPEELDFRKKKPDYFDSNRNMIHRQDSKDSIQSNDSSNSSIKNKNSSNLSLDAIDEVLKKSLELIETRIESEGIYRKAGSLERANKIYKKMLKRKLSDLEKYRNDVYELTESLKRYLKEGCDSLVTKETVEHVNKICDNTQWLEHNTRQKVIVIVMDAPKKDTLIFLVRHLIKLIKYESTHNVSKAEMLWIWSRMLNDQLQVVDSDEKMINFLKILVDVFDETKSDVTVKPKGMSNGLLNDLKNLQKEKDRISKYDNVPDDPEPVSKEATIFEEKTEEAEQTKL